MYANARDTATDKLFQHLLMQRIFNAAICQKGLKVAMCHANLAYSQFRLEIHTEREIDAEFG